MNLPAAIAAAVLIVAGVFALAMWLAGRLDPPQRGRHVPFADPADRTDPDGDRYVARLREDDEPGPDLDALERPSPVGTGWFPALPDDEPADITGVQPADVRYLGVSSEEYVDELFDKHAEATP